MTLFSGWQQLHITANGRYLLERGTEVVPTGYSAGYKTGGFSRALFIPRAGTGITAVLGGASAVPEIGVDDGLDVTNNAHWAVPLDQDALALGVLHILEIDDTSAALAVNVTGAGGSTDFYVRWR